MDSILLPDSLSLTRLRATAAVTITTTSSCTLQFPCLFTSRPGRKILSVFATSSGLGSALRMCSAVSASGTFTANSASHSSSPANVEPSSGVYTVGDFMTRKEDLHVVKPTTTVDKALEILVERRITGLPVINDDWKLVGLVSDYDLLALDSISGGGRAKNSMFPEVESTWKTFNEVQKLLSKTNGKVVGDLMTPAPVVVRETTNLEDAARFSLSIFSFRFKNSRTEKSLYLFQLILNSSGRKIEYLDYLSDVRLLLETKYRRLAVVNVDGKLVGILTRRDVVRAALQIKRAIEME